MNAASIGNIGAALSTNLRHDLFPSYIRALADIANYAEDGLNIMIEKGWFEEPPMVVDRKDLINSNNNILSQ